MNGLDLFSGIGGNTLALSEWVNTVAYCEADKHAQAVLLSRMAEGKIERAPIWDDVETLERSMFDIPINIIIAGFPCQDISVAGTGKGLAGKRSGLYWQVHRLVQEIQPQFVFLENVPAIRTRGLSEVVASLTDLGYDCRWTRVSAESVGAPHRRERWFLLAHTSIQGLEGLRSTQRVPAQITGTHSTCDNVADSHTRGLSTARTCQQTTGPTRENLQSTWWSTEPDVGRVADGVPHRVDRIKRLGNAVVPLQAKTAFKKLIGID